ncbi:hypothetical protein FO519_008489 [Halicephalobus sp. NKZ332]|nr:hypothetical protein FO519_008489 [Halicephalobus sp. NKZ332]
MATGVLQSMKPMHNLAVLRLLSSSKSSTAFIDYTGVKVGGYSAAVPPALSSLSSLRKISPLIKCVNSANILFSSINKSILNNLGIPILIVSRYYSTKIQRSKGIDITVNPEPEMMEKYAHEHEYLNQIPFSECYEFCLKNFGPDDFQFYMAIDKETQEFMACVNMCRYRSIEGSLDLVCMGEYVVAPKQQGKGVGKFLSQWAIYDPNFFNRNRGILGVPAMSKKYADRSGLNKYYESDLVYQHRKISDYIRDIDPIKVILFDTKVNGNVRRDKFLIDWMKVKNMKASKVALNEDDEVVGYIGIYEIKDILSLNPFFAVDIKTASTLLRTSLESIDNLNYYRTFANISFEENPFSTSLFNQLTENREIKLKYRGQFTEFVPKVKYNQVYSTIDYGPNII